MFVRYDEFIPVKNMADLVKVPASVPLEVACLLPCGALKSYSAIQMVKPFFLDKLENKDG